MLHARGQEQTLKSLMNFNKCYLDPFRRNESENYVVREVVGDSAMKKWSIRFTDQSAQAFRLKELNS